MTALDKFGPNERTDARTLALLELLSEPKGNENYSQPDFFYNMIHFYIELVTENLFQFESAETI